MTIRVELNPETEARLKAEARAKGLPVETVAEQLLSNALAGRSVVRDHDHQRVVQLAETTYLLDSNVLAD